MSIDCERVVLRSVSTLTGNGNGNAIATQESHY